MKTGKNEGEEEEEIWIQWGKAAVQQRLITVLGSDIHQQTSPDHIYFTISR